MSWWPPGHGPAVILLIDGIKKSFPARTAATAAPGREVFLRCGRISFSHAIDKKRTDLHIQVYPRHVILDMIEKLNIYLLFVEWPAIIKLVVILVFHCQ